MTNNMTNNMTNKPKPHPQFGTEEYDEYLRFLSLRAKILQSDPCADSYLDGDYENLDSYTCAEHGE